MTNKQRSLCQTGKTRLTADRNGQNGYDSPKINSNIIKFSISAKEATPPKEEVTCSSKVDIFSENSNRGFYQSY